MDTISVIIVNWNGKKWLQKCLSSLSSQTYKKLEIIVVDNNSSDHSIDFVKRNFPHVKIIKCKQNFGFATANSIGIKSSKGKYIILINNDTWIERDFVEQLSSFYLSHNYDIVAPVEHTYDKKKRIDLVSTIDFTGSAAYYFPKNIHTKLFYLSGVCLFFLKTFYKETLGLDNNFFMYFEDVDWFWRLTLLGKKFARADNISLYHNGVGSTGAGIKYNMFLWRNQNILQMLIKNYSAFSLIFILPLYFIQNVFEMVFFLIIGKPKISYTYLLGWTFNIKHMKIILRERKWIQRNRRVSDIEIIKKMYHSAGKLQSLVIYLKTKYAKSV